DARLTSGIADWGGGIPTLKLLPDSPARTVVTQSGMAATSQNGYVWAPGTLRDIGAWGAGPNRAPTSAGPHFRRVQGTPLMFSGSDILERSSDPDGDELKFAE